MSKRIRYALEGDNVFMSTRAIETNQGWVRVRYNMSNMVVHIVNADDHELALHTFVASSEHRMKKAIKETLIEMGASFEKENRAHVE